MAFDIGQYIDSLKQNPFWFGRITNDINKLLVNREYIDLFIQIYIQWSSDNSIECMPHFKKIDFSQFKVYIELEKMYQCYVYDNCNMSIFIQSSNDKEGFYSILHIIRIHTGLRQWNKKDQFHMLLCDKNPLGINQPCIKIAENEVFFENIEWLLSGAQIPLKFKGMMQSSVNNFV